MDGTPIYDIKPYLAYTDAHPEASGGFTDDSGWRELEVVFPDEFASFFSADELASLKEILALDPRPRYQDDPRKQYGLLFAGRNIRFSVEGETLAVIDVQA